MSKLFFLLAGIFIIGCTKEINCHDTSKPVTEEDATAKGGAPKPTGYTNFTIRQGQHYCDQNSLKSVRTSEMKFMAQFDNSAIYQTAIPENQYDINKLWGFSEGINNQYNSARIGCHGIMMLCVYMVMYMLRVFGICKRSRRFPLVPKLLVP